MPGLARHNGCMSNRENKSMTRYSVHKIVTNHNYWATPGETLSTCSLVGYVEAETKRKAQNKARKLYGVSFSGKFGAWLKETE